MEGHPSRPGPWLVPLAPQVGLCLHPSCRQIFTGADCQQAAVAHTRATTHPTVCRPDDVAPAITVRW